MTKDKIHIQESNASLFWGLVVIVCTAIGTWLLIGSFVSKEAGMLTFKQILTLLLFLLSFLGIYKLTEPKYHIIFSFREPYLEIEVKKGNTEVSVREISVTYITDLKFISHNTRNKSEAYFDFAMSYRLMYKDSKSDVFTDLIDTNSDENIVLKVEDIAKIMRFIRSRNGNINVPKIQSDFFNL